MAVNLAGQDAGLASSALTAANGKVGAVSDPLERLMQLARQVLAAPLVYISLIENKRELLIAGDGLPPGWRIGEGLPAIAARRNGRTELCVLGAAPLTLANGNLGCIAVAGSEPREWRTADQDLLVGFAITAAALLDAREAARLTATRVRDLKRELVRASVLAPERLRLLTENAQDIIYRYDFKPVRGFSYISPAVSSVLGYSVEEAVADPDLLNRVTFAEDRAGVLPGADEVEHNREALVRFYHKDGRVIWLDLRRAPLYDAEGELIGFDGIARDVTQFMRTAEALRFSEQRFRELFNSAQRQAQELALLDQVRNTLTKVLDLAVIYKTVVEAVSETFGYSQVSIYALEAGLLSLQHQVGYSSVLNFIPLSNGIMGRVASTGTAILIEDVVKEPAFMGAIADITSEVCVPLFDDERVAGVLNVESTGGITLGEADLHLMTALSEQVSIAINRARLYTTARDNESKYRSVVENVTEVIFQTDIEGLWTFLNPAWSEITGFPLSQSIGTGMIHYVHPDDRVRLESEFEALITRRKDYSRYSIRCQTRGNGIRWLEVNARPITDPEGEIVGASGTLNDVTERRLAEETLVRQNEELEALHETTLGLINQLDVTSLLETIIARAGAFMGTPNGFLYALEPGASEMTLQMGTGIFEQVIGARLQRGEGLSGRIWESGEPAAVDDYTHWSGRKPELDELSIRAVAGMPLRAGADVVGVLGLAYMEQDRSFTMDDVALLNRFGQLASLTLENARLYDAAQQELTERKRAEERLAYLAMHDSLTGLPNRTLLNDRLHQAIRTSQREGAPLALLLMDVDRFKEVNDTLGHQAGDRLLQQIGRRLVTVLRASDTVARLGGDEFAVLLPGAEAAGAAEASRKLIGAMEAPFDLEGHNLDVRISIGVALLPEHGQDEEVLLRRGDVAMYVAKRGGTGYAFYSPDQDPYSPGRLALAGDLRRSIEQDELVLYYQPKVNNFSGRVTGVEALVRWRHPQRGLLPPDQFIPLAEHTGLIGMLSQWVLNAALHQCKCWREAGLHMPVAVNLSMRDLHDDTLPGIVEALLLSTGVEPALLTVEITEDAVMADLVGTLDVLTRLRALGVRLAIDDFGTGQSSLAQLKRLPVGQLKIDKSFVREMASNDNDAVIVRSTIDLGHNLGLTVVAEGVEDAASWQMLTKLGCDEAQGYYLSRPVPNSEFIAWLKERGEYDESQTSGGAAAE